MKKYGYKLLGILLFVFTETFLHAQPFTLEVEIRNQPDNDIVIGTIKGDDFIPIDTLKAKPAESEQAKKISYTFPQDTPIGMYRLTLGQTLYSKVMEEAPQQLDFIFNKENLIFETDFNAPQDSFIVVLSEENRVWIEYARQKNEYKKEQIELEKELNLCQKKKKETPDSTANEDCNIYVNQYNSLQNKRETYITEMSNHYPKLLATEMIEMYREPFTDGNLTESQRKKLFQQDFFKSLSFSDERLIQSSIYSDRIFYYLTSYNHAGATKEELEKDYIKAVDLILANTNQNPKVYTFICNYITHGFEVLKMDKVTDYIKGKNQ